MGLIRCYKTEVFSTFIIIMIFSHSTVKHTA